MTEQACYLTRPLDDGAQLDLAGGETPLAPGRREQPPLFDGRPFDRPTGQAPPSRYHSPAWQGTVEQASLDAGPDMTPDDHNRPAYLGPLGPHRCPGPATCPQRWLTDDEMED